MNVYIKLMLMGLYPLITALYLHSVRFHLKVGLLLEQV